jgi:acetyl esterase/lipase
MSPSRIPSLLLCVVLPLSSLAQTQQVIHLWPNGAPGFESRRDMPEEAKDYWVRSINNPSLTVFPAPKEKANGCAVVVAPGGGFRELVFHAEGEQPAQFLNSIGVTVFVLKYRLPNQEHSPYSVDNVKQDAFRALRTVRSRAAEFGVDPNRVGILGFSAGGSLENLIAFESGAGDPAAADPVDRLSGRPDFVMEVYPGGKTPDVVPAGTPPAFLLAANDDDYGCDKVALDLYVKFRAANVPVEAHFIERGRHAFNMGDRSIYSAIRGWPQRMADWMGDSGFLVPKGPAPAR